MKISNGLLTIDFEERQGCYSVFDHMADKYRIRSAVYSVEEYCSSDAIENRAGTDVFSDEIGHGRLLEMQSVMHDGTILSLTLFLYDNEGFITSMIGLQNHSGRKIRVKEMAHLRTAGTQHSYFSVGPDAHSHHRMLTGEAGFAYAHLKDDVNGRSLNCLTIVYMDRPESAVAVLGDLTMHEFQTEVLSQATDLRTGFAVTIRMFDGTGKLVDPGTVFHSDLAYLSLTEKDPFKALRSYAWHMALAMCVRLNNYNDYVSVCLWYVFAFSLGDRSANTSSGGIDETLAMIQSGITKYAPPLIRLVPDEYVNPNEQLWWDEEHWQKYVHLTPPYETLEKWVNKLHELGGEGGLYMQPTMRSDDYCRLFPGHMLYNDAGHEADYTDPAFIRHMKKVYRAIKAAGIISMFYDYSMLVRADIRRDENALLREGGFEDPYATSVSAYRNIFRLAKETCGRTFLVTENTWNYSGQDLGIGLIDAQRSKMDNVGMNREVIKSGIRQWYRNKMTKLIDPDVKNFTVGDADTRRKEVSLMGLLFGKTMLGSSITRYDDDAIRDIGRIFPMPMDHLTATPVDLFLSSDAGNASVFDYALSEDDHIVALLNEEMHQTVRTLELSEQMLYGGLALSSDSIYDIWDFWNESYIGRLRGNETLRQVLRKGECRVLAIRKVQKKPYLLSTNRHILQGVVEAKALRSSRNSLDLELHVIGNDPMHAVVALPSERMTLESGSCETGQVKVRFEKDAFDPLIHIYAESALNADIRISLRFSAKKGRNKQPTGRVNDLKARVDRFSGSVQLTYDGNEGCRFRILKDGELLTVTKERTITDSSLEENTYYSYKVIPEAPGHKMGRGKTVRVHTGRFMPSLRFGPLGKETPGKDGFVLFNPIEKGKDIESLPPYVGEITVQNRQDYIYPIKGDDPRGIILPGNGTVTMGMVHDSKELVIRITFKDRKQHWVTLYAVDCNRSGRTMKLQVRNSRGRILVPQRTIPEYGEGVCISFSSAGCIEAVLTNGAVNACVSAVYFA